MKEFFDDETGLTFIGFSGSDLHNHVHDKEYEFYNDQLNNWIKDKDIKRYIVANMDIGRFFTLITKISDSVDAITTVHHFFILDNNNLIGSAVVSKNKSPLHTAISPLSDKWHDIALDDNPTVDILYLVVHPKFRGLGYGTRIIKSIKNHEKELAENTNTSGILAEVRKINEPSKRAFLKNDFIVIPAKHLIEPQKNQYAHLYDRLYNGIHADKFKEK